MSGKGRRRCKRRGDSVAESREESIIILIQHAETPRDPPVTFWNQRESDFLNVLILARASLSPGNVNMVGDPAAAALKMWVVACGAVGVIT